MIIDFQQQDIKNRLQLPLVLYTVCGRTTSVPTTLRMRANSRATGRYGPAFVRRSHDCRPGHVVGGEN